MKKILFTLLTIFAISYSPLAISCTHASPQPKEIIAEATYQAGDGDTPVAAQEAALLLAKRNALEQCGTLVTSSTTIQNYIVKDDTVRSLAAGVMEVTILDKKRTPVGNGTEFYVKIRAIVYPDKLNSALKLLQNGLLPSPLPKKPVHKTYNDTANKLLLVAVKNNDIEQVNQAFAMGADPDYSAGEDYLCVPFFFAIAHDSTEIMQCFINNGVDINRKTTFDFTPLRMAAVTNHFNALKLLLDSGADPNIVSPQTRCTLLQDISGHDENLRMVEYLIDKGERLNTQDNYGNTPLMMACKANQTKIATLLINSGADVNYINNYSQKALDFAMSMNNKDLINLLLPLTH